jgi:hypothetical protein
MTKVGRKTHQDRMATIHAEAQRIVATGRCPQCGTPLRRNLALNGWWQCDAYGRPDFRRPEHRALPDCSFQTFTE